MSGASPTDQSLTVASAGVPVGLGKRAGWEEFIRVAALLGFGVLVNIGLLALFHWPELKPLIGDERFYVPRIRAYGEGHPVDWDPLWPALYIDVMGLLSRATGGYRPAVVQAAQLAMFVAAAWLFWRIARRLLPSAFAALVALALFLLTPDLAAYTGFHLAEMLHLFLALAAFWLVLEHGDRLVALAAAGVLLGLALAAKLLLLAFLPMILGAVAWRYPGTVARRLGAAAFMSAGVAVAALPFMARNEYYFGVFTVGDSIVLNRLIALRDRAPRDWQGATTIRSALDEFQGSASTFPERNAIARRQLAVELREQSGLATYLSLAPKQYQRLLHHDTYFTTQLQGGPRQAFALDEGPAVTGIRLWAHAAYALLLVGGCLGLAALRWTRPGGLHVPALFLLYNLAVFAVVITQTRYMVPVYPALMLFAGIAAHGIAIGWRDTRQYDAFMFSRTRAAFGLAGAAVLLSIAFPEAWDGTWLR